MFLRNWVLRHCSRITSSGNFLVEIDGLRFVAIAWVALYHVSGYAADRAGFDKDAAAINNLLSYVLLQGDLGVPLFFIISGFILGLPFAQYRLLGAKPVMLGKYFLRRVTRLEPPYFIHLGFVLLMYLTAVYFGVYSGTSGDVHDLGFALKRLAASAVYSHNWIYGQGNAINGVLWSLEVEVQFYILVPLLTLVFALRKTVVRRTVMTTIIVFFSMIRWLAEMRHFYILGLTVIGNVQYFLIGFLLVDIFIAEWKQKPSQCRRWDLIAAAAWLSLVPLRAWDGWHLAIPWAALLGYIGAFRGKAINAIFRNVWLATIGGMCYTIYLYHYLFISALGRVTSQIAKTRVLWEYTLIQSLLIVPPLLLLCALLFVFFERPFMARDWHKRIWKLRNPGNPGHPF